MQRAQRTLELLDLGCTEPYPWQQQQHKSKSIDPEHSTLAPVTVTPAIREWDYGDYEGITSAEIRARRSEQGLGSNWDIWTDGCPGGESPQDVTSRVDALIKEIRDKYHGPCMQKKDGEEHQSEDVLVVAHGHILRVFAMRWVGMPLENTKLIMEAGGVGTLSYEHHRVEEPAILLGGGFVVGGDVKEEVEMEEEQGKVK